MIIDSDILRKISSVLEKAAGYVESIEAEKISSQHAVQTKAAEELAEKLRAATGEDLDAGVVDKLAKLDPDVAKMLGKLAGESTGVDQMGEPVSAGTTKVASGGKNTEDARFLNWVVGP
jgi:hypothetical protein